MEKCINCVYFFSCEKANEERICEKYKFERKEVQKKKVEKGIMNAIEKESKKMQIANLFYEICPHVPPQILATTVNQTMKNFEELDQLYSPNYITAIKSKNIPSTIKESKMLDDNYTHIPRID